jgi:hypothetical protein
MSDFFSSLFGGGGGGGGGDGGGGGFAPTGGQGGGDFLSSMFSGGQGGGDGGGGLFGGGGDGLGMGNFDPTQMFQQTPQQQAAQGGDPGGQLSGARGGQSGQSGQDGQGGQGGQGAQGGQSGKGQPQSFLQLLGDALSGRMQQPGYTGLGGVASQAAQSGQLPQQPSFDQPSNTSDPTRMKVPGEMPGGPSGAPQAGPGQPGVPNQSAAAQAKGEEAGGLAPPQTEEAPIPPSRPASLGPGDDPNKDPHPGTSHGTPASLGPGQGGGQQGQGNQFGQFMQSPLGQVVQSLIGQMLGRMGPGGAALGQILSPLLSQLAGQAGFGGQGGQGGSQWNPETPAIDRGRDWMNRAIPGGAAGVGRFTNAMVNAESNGRNIVSGTDRDSHGLTAAQGGNPNEISQGYFQIQNHPGGTWTTAARRAGVDLNKYPSPRSAPFEVQHKVAQGIPVSAWGGRTKRMLHQQFGAFNDRLTLGQVEQQFGSGQRRQPMPASLEPNYANARRRHRRDMAMGLQF